MAYQNLSKVPPAGDPPPPPPPYCIFCYKEVRKELSSGVQPQNNSLGSKNKFGSIERFLGFRFKCHNSRVVGSSSCADTFKFCSDCELLLDKVADLVGALRRTELELEWKIGRIKDIMVAANKVPSRVAFVKGYYSEMGKESMVGQVEEWRRKLVRKCTLKLMGSFPKVKLCKLEEKEGDGKGQSSSLSLNCDAAVTSVTYLPNRRSSGKSMAPSSPTISKGIESEPMILVLKEELKVEVESESECHKTERGDFGVSTPARRTPEIVNEGLGEEIAKDDDDDDDIDSIVDGREDEEHQVIIEDPLIEVTMEFPHNPIKKELVDNENERASWESHEKNLDLNFPCKVPGCRRREFESEGQVEWHISRGHKATRDTQKGNGNVGRRQRNSIRVARRRNNKVGAAAAAAHVADGGTVERKRCKNCGKEFTSIYHLRRHRYTVHREEVDLKFACKVAGCERKFETAAEAKHHHSLWHKSGGKLQARRKSKGMMIGGGGGVPVCELCGKSFRDRYHLNTHLKYHSGPDSWKFECSTCGRKCFTRQRLERHMRTHTGEKPCTCQSCGRKFETAVGLNRHKGSVHKGKKGAGGTNVKVQTGSRSDVSGGGAAGAAAPVVCELCGKSFYDRSTLYLHLRSHSGPDSWRFQCSTCGKKCIRRYMLERHMRTHTREKRCICGYCGAAFGREDSLKYHKAKMHPGVVVVAGISTPPARRTPGNGTEGLGEEIIAKHDDGIRVTAEDGWEEDEHQVTEEEDPLKDVTHG